MSNSIVKTLTELGIEKKQAEVYLACLELGSASVQELSEKSGVKRTSIYNFLEEMKTHGLLSEIKNGNKTLLIAEDPNNLVKQAEAKFTLMKEALPDLMSIYNLPGNKPKVLFFPGIEGIKKVYIEHILASSEHIYGFSDYEKMFEAIDEEWWWPFPVERVRKGMKFYSIAKKGKWGELVRSKDVQQMRETKLVEDVEFDTEINIFGNKVALMSFRRPYAAVVIEDRAIVASMKSVWKLLWNLLPKYESHQQ